MKQSAVIAAKNAPLIGLLGQPNTGKSTLFNALTGARQHVGNWPGKTVEKKEGSFKYRGKTYTLLDLPGTYSLSANSEEELVTRQNIIGNDIDLVFALVDASQLERSMFFTFGSRRHKTARCRFIEHDRCGEITGARNR